MLIASGRESAAEEHVWARIVGMGPSAGYMSNGYGSYYVPKSLAGMNQEGEPVKNSGGLIVQSKQPKPMPSTKKPLWKRLTFRRDRSESSEK
jgi:hypothetical protein